MYCNIVYCCIPLKASTERMLGRMNEKRVSMHAPYENWLCIVCMYIYIYIYIHTYIHTYIYVYIYI